MRRHLPRLLGVLAVLIAGPLAAQDPPTVSVSPRPTPEGTVITNTVTASYSDANGNAYTPVSANVAVTVGFKAGIDVTEIASVTPSSPSTGNEVNFRINNIGNGTDQVSLAVSIGAGASITGYKIGATSYADLAALNAALATTDIDGVPASETANSVLVTVVYSVDAGQGGVTIPLTVTATSLRHGSMSDAGTTNILPPISGTVTVTAPGAMNRLPGGPYTVTFTVANTTSSALTFNLTLTNTGSISASSLPSGNTVTVAAGATANVNVNYTVANDAAGSTGSVNLTATSGSFSDSGDTPHQITIIKPLLQLSKSAYTDAALTTPVGGSVTPGQTIYYKLTISNTGTAAAANVNVTDQLPEEVSYVSHVSPGGSWTVSYNSGNSTITATSASLAAGTSVDVVVQVTIK